MRRISSQPTVVDPEVQAALAALPPFPAETGDDIAERRRAAQALRAARNLELEPETDFSRTDRHVRGMHGQPAVTVRVYRPLGRSSPLPALLYMHGGGFSLGDLEVEDRQCVRICREVGCLVVSVDYRLAPEDPYPAAVRDCYGALEWVARDHQALGVAPDRLAVAGGSAGGGLAAAVALMARDRGGPPLCLQLLIYPEIDDRSDNESSRFDGVPIFDGKAKARSWRHYLGDSKGEVPIYAAPNRCDDLAGLPATFLVTAGLDPLRDEGAEYGAKLVHSGVAVEWHHYPDVPHGWDIFAPRSVSARRSWATRLTAMRTAFGEDPA